MHNVQCNQRVLCEGQQTISHYKHALDHEAGWQADADGNADADDDADADADADADEVDGKADAEHNRKQQ